jgi:uncharacterized membrane protein YjgN (DUF898 family)
MNGMNFDAAGMFFTMIILYAGVIVLSIALNSFIEAESLKIIWKDLTIKDLKLETELKTSELVKIDLVNIFALIFSLGLVWPWATVRKIKYRISVTKIYGDLSGFQASSSAAGEALGEEIADLAGFDFSF